MNLNFLFHNVAGCIFLLSLNAFGQVNWQKMDLESIYELADKDTDANHFDLALEKLEYLLQQKEKLPDQLLWKTHSLLGYTYYYLGQYDNSNQQYALAYELQNVANDTLKMINSLRAMGMNYRSLGLFGLSIQKYQEALSLTQEFSEGGSNLHHLYNSISLLYNSQKDFPKALDYAKQTIDLAKTAEDSSLLSYAFTNAGLAFMNLGEIDSSILYNRKSLAIKTLLKDKSNMASNYNNLGLDFMELEQYANAKEMFDSANYWYLANNSKEGQIIINNNYGSLFLKTNELQKSKDHLRLAEDLLNNLPNKTLLADNLETQVKLYSSLGDFKYALALQTRLIQVNEEIFQEEVLKLKNLESAFAISQVEKEKLLLKQETDQAKSESKRSYLMVLALASIAVFFGLITLIYSKFSHSLKAKNELIALQKIDIIHRTNNVLARVQATLKSIADGFGEPEKEKLMIAESVIVSAAGLQEFTYGIEKNNNKLDLGNYLNEVVNRLRNTFTENEKEIAFHFDLENDCQIPVEKALNCGIIVSELVLNAIKYAFKESTQNKKIMICLKKNNTRLVISVKDNGKGIPESKKSVTGLSMVQKLSKYIQAELETLSDSHGTTYFISLKTI